MDKFTRAYIECALWSSTDSVSDDSLDDTYSIEDISPETLAEIEKDCAEFQQNNATDLATGTPERGGHDFWLTRNGHGAGFWDGDWPKEIGQRLTDEAHVYGTYDLYVGDDGKIHGA